MVVSEAVPGLNSLPGPAPFTSCRIGVLSEAVPGLNFLPGPAPFAIFPVLLQNPGCPLSPALLRSSGVVDMLTESGHALTRLC